MAAAVRRSRVEIRWCSGFVFSEVDFPPFCTTPFLSSVGVVGWCVLLAPDTKKMDHDKKVRSDLYMTCSCVHNMHWCMSESPCYLFPRQPFSDCVCDSYRYSSSFNRLDQRGEEARMA